VQLGKWTPHANFVWEKPPRNRAYVSITEGLAYQLRKNLILDLTAQHLGASSAPVDHHIQAGLIYNFGNFRHR